MTYESPIRHSNPRIRHLSKALRAEQSAIWHADKALVGNPRLARTNGKLAARYALESLRHARLAALVVHQRGSDV